MWYEILPSFGIIYALLVAPCASNIYYKMQFMRNGKSQPRNMLTNEWDHMAYKRDIFITGSEYIPRGLESIPDEEK